MKIDKTLKEWKQSAGLTSSEIAKLMALYLNLTIQNLQELQLKQC